MALSLSKFRAVLGDKAQMLEATIHIIWLVDFQFAVSGIDSLTSESHPLNTALNLERLGAKTSGIIRGGVLSIRVKNHPANKPNLMLQ